jgi:hypothetical protein
MRVVLLAAVCMAVACGPDSASTTVPTEVVDVPPRARTAGDELMRLAPSGAALIAELDIARLRANEVVGPAVMALAAIDISASELGVGFNVVRAADAIVIASYAVGANDATSLTLLRGPGVAELEVGPLITDDTRAIGPEYLVARATKLVAGTGKSVADDSALLRVRTFAMPEQATGAALRVTARLDFEARLALSGRFELDTVPVSLSVWGDVADDLAIVGMMAADDEDEAVDLVRSFAVWRDRVSNDRWVRSRMLHFVLRDITVERRGQSARAVLLIGPRRLERLVEKLGPKSDDGKD